MALFAAGLKYRTLHRVSLRVNRSAYHARPASRVLVANERLLPESISLSIASPIRALAVAATGGGRGNCPPAAGCAERQPCSCAAQNLLHGYPFICDSSYTHSQGTRFRRALAGWQRYIKPPPRSAGPPLWKRRRYPRSGRFQRGDTGLRPSFLRRPNNRTRYKLASRRTGMAGCAI